MKNVGDIIMLNNAVPFRSVALMKWLKSIDGNGMTCLRRDKAMLHTKFKDMDDMDLQVFWSVRLMIDENIVRTEECILVP